MPTLITTAGAVDSNAYVSTADADSYFDTTLNADVWLNTSQANKERGIIQATRLFEQMIEWKGIPSSFGQALKWPRRGILTQVSETGGGVFFHRNYIKIYGGLLNPIGVELPTDTIPEFLKDAIAEFSLALLTSDRIAEADSGTINSISIPGLSIGLGSSSGSSSSKRTLIPPHVYLMIAYYADTIVGHTPRRLVRS